jgi:hypothetical protein
MKTRNSPNPCQKTRTGSSHLDFAQRVKPRGRLFFFLLSTIYFSVESFLAERERLRGKKKGRRGVDKEKKKGVKTIINFSK